MVEVVTEAVVVGGGVIAVAVSIADVVAIAVSAVSTGNLCSGIDFGTRMPPLVGLAMDM